jgi:hypothetical protein
MAVRVGTFLSGLAVVILGMYGVVWFVIAWPASEWWPVILVSTGLAIVSALALIWLAVLVVHVIARAIRVTDEAEVR